jgi:hypothetical protein
MRVYLKNGKKDGTTIYASKAYYEVSDDLGNAWIDSGDALKANDKNEIEKDKPSSGRRSVIGRASVAVVPPDTKDKE